MNKFDDVVRIKNPANAFAYIAFWQVLVFVMLLCLIWACEETGILYVYFQEPLASSSAVKAGVISIGVVVCAFVLIGNTFLQQRRVVAKFLIICSYCKNIQIDPHIWQQIEGYFAKHFRTTFSHGICPQCYEKVQQEIDKIRPSMKP